jgi:hypothetical protein
MIKGGAWFVSGELKAVRQIGFVGDNRNKGAEASVSPKATGSKVATEKKEVKPKTKK